MQEEEKKTIDVGEADEVATEIDLEKSTEQTEPVAEEKVEVEQVEEKPVETKTEETKDEKTNNVAEDLILYAFLGVFMIFIVDLFTRASHTYKR